VVRVSALSILRIRSPDGTAPSAAPLPPLSVRPRQPPSPAPPAPLTPSPPASASLPARELRDEAGPGAATARTPTRMGMPPDPPLAPAPPLPPPPPALAVTGSWDGGGARVPVASRTLHTRTTPPVRVPPAVARYLAMGHSRSSVKQHARREFVPCQSITSLQHTHPCLAKCPRLRTWEAKTREGVHACHETRTARPART
jgi:hypothetical protein